MRASGEQLSFSDRVVLPFGAAPDIAHPRRQHADRARLLSRDAGGTLSPENPHIGSRFDR